MVLRNIELGLRSAEVVFRCIELVSSHKELMLRNTVGVESHRS